MIKPTVGRVVHYHPTFSDQEQGMSYTDTQPLAAIVACVWSDTCVNLAVIDGNGYTHSRTSVLLHQEGNPKPDRGFAEWMPYQTGQAAKTEKLQAQLDARLAQPQVVTGFTTDGKYITAQTVPNRY